MRPGGRPASSASVRAGDSGQVVTVLMVIVSLGLLMVIMSVMLPVGQAADLRARSVTAADAAALAGAERIRDDFLSSLAVGPADRAAVLGVLGCGLGAGAAVDFAARNDARVTSYCYYPQPDQVRVSVLGNPTADGGGRASSDATAALGVRFGSCYWHDDPAPTPTPTPTPPPTSTPPPPGPPPPPPPVPDTFTELRCGSLVLRFREDGDSGRLTLLTPLDRVRDALEPRLVD